MKRARFFLVLALAAMVLSGCCISHEWAEATCESPKACQKCGQTEGQALGHIWADAACEAPQTCTRCQKAQGEALGHDYRCISFTATEYDSRCTLCQDVKTFPIQDMEAFAAELVCGEWKLGRFCYKSGEEYAFTDDGSLEAYIMLSENAGSNYEPSREEYEEEYAQLQQLCHMVWKPDGTCSAPDSEELSEFEWRCTAEYTNSVTSENGFALFFGIRQTGDEDAYADLFYIDGHDPDEMSFLIAYRLARQ